MQWIRDNAVPNTANTYKPYAKEFQRFCLANNVPSSPAQNSTVSSFLIYLTQQRKLSRGTINDVACSAIADLHRFQDQQPQRSVMVKEIKKAITRLTEPPKQTRPLPASVLMDIAAVSDFGDKYQLRNHFMHVLGFKAFMRRSEIANLNPDDVWLESVMIDGKLTEVLFVLIQKSKTDQGRKGHTVVLARDPEDIWKCPMVLFQLYQHLASQYPDRKGFFFNFSGANNRITGETVNRTLKTACARAGIPRAKYSAHCLRAGGCTAAVAQGIELRLVARHGNWKSTAIFRYISDSLAQKLSVSLAIEGVLM